MVRAPAGAPLLLLECPRATRSTAPRRGSSCSSASGSRSSRRTRARRRERVAEQLDGRRLESVEAVGKNLVLRFEGGVVLRSHLRMSGRWSVRPRGEPRAGRPWLVLRGAELEGVLWDGPVLELHTRALAGSGRTSSRRRPTSTRCSRACARADGTRTLGETLQDQTLVAGIGNMWMAETLWRARLSPWLRLADVAEADRRRALETAAAR